MPVDPDGGYAGPYIDVDVTSMRDAAVELSGTGNTLMSAIDDLMTAAALPLAALPADSDLCRAYAFWWGRWSAVVETSEPAIRGAASVTAGAADGFTTVDENGRIELHVPRANPVDEETETRIAGYLAATDGELLIKAATGLDAAYQAFWTARGRVAGVKSDLVSSWDSVSGKSMLAYLDDVESALSQAGAQMSIIGDALHSHGTTASTARGLARTYVVDAYEDPTSVDSGGLEVILQPFLDSHLRLTKDLWVYGSLAPGGIPLPPAPPRPPSDWKDWVFGSDYPAGWRWDGDAKSYFQPGGDPSVYDPDHPLYGYDEWGNRVPAYQAGMPIPIEMQESGVGGLLKILAKIGKAAGTTASGARAIAPEADELAGLVKGSYGWRAAHIDRHIREWYGLADDAPIPTWMRDEYLKMIVDSGVKQGKVFTWSLRGETGAQPTYSTLRYQNGRWLVSQYYVSGERAGEFATAFEPTARQLAKMLQQSGIAP